MQFIYLDQMQMWNADGFSFLANIINDVHSILSRGAVGHVKRGISMSDFSSKLRHRVVAVREQ